MNQLINVYKILSDETRLRTLILLYQEELCVCEINGILDLSQPKISKNLSKLRDMNFVIDERKEKFVFYKLNREQSFLIQTLEMIVSKIDQYPGLIKDRERLGEKEKFLNQCTTNFEL